MKKLTDKQKLELLKYLIDNSDYDEVKTNMEVRLLNQIHRIVHPYKKCRHPDWEDDTVEMYKEIKK